MKMLKIKSCSDPQMWYSDKVGQTFPVIREGEEERQYLTREPTGYLNVVNFDDAEIIEAVE